MSTDRIHFERFEIKYRLSQKQAAVIRAYLDLHLAPDEFAAGRADRCYPVHSLYLDADDLCLFQSTMDGERNRYKLRVRYYDEHPDSPIFFEIKQRVNEHILKYRAQVRRSAVASLLAGHRPQMLHLSKPDVRQLGNLQLFSRLMQRTGAKPRVHVAYMRQAWMGTHDGAIRVTLDRSVLCDPEFSAKTLLSQDAPKEVFSGEQILELKFQQRMSGWMADLVRRFELVRSSAAKYAEGVTALGRGWIASRGGAVVSENTIRSMECPRRMPSFNGKITDIAALIPAGTGAEMRLW